MSESNNYTDGMDDQRYTAREYDIYIYNDNSGHPIGPILNLFTGGGPAVGQWQSLIHIDPGVRLEATNALAAHIASLDGPPSPTLALAYAFAISPSTAIPSATFSGDASPSTAIPSAATLPVPAPAAAAPHTVSVASTAAIDSVTVTTAPADPYNGRTPKQQIKRMRKVPKAKNGQAYDRDQWKLLYRSVEDRYRGYPDIERQEVRLNGTIRRETKARYVKYMQKKGLTPWLDTNTI